MRSAEAYQIVEVGDRNRGGVLTDRVSELYRDIMITP